MLSRITEFMRLEHIAPELQATDKPSLLMELSSLVCASHTSLNVDDVYKKLLEREAKASTGADHGVAIPHATLSEIQELIVGFGISKRGVPFAALDNQDSNLFFVVLAPTSTSSKQVSYLQLISAICRLMRSQSLRNKLLSSNGASDVLRILEQEESSRLNSPAATLYP
ncbi:MAG: hypothetical protein RJB13_1366 [Pseudomonadota bacterium]